MLQTTTTREHLLGVAPLSALDLPAVPFIRASAAAGFASVGLRVQAVSATDHRFPTDMKSSEYKSVVSSLSETGTKVTDIEVLTLRPDVGAEDWLRLLELGADLGASYVNVNAELPSGSQMIDAVGQLTSDALPFGIQPVLEPVAFRQLNSFDEAVSIARQTGCAVLLDVLHFVRTGASLATIADNKELFPLFQLCDAAASVPGASLNQSQEERLSLMVAEARTARLLPGEGDAPILELLQLLGDNTRISVEVPNEQLRGGGSAETYLRLLRESSSRFLKGMH